MAAPLRFVAISGSLRAASTNTALLRHLTSIGAEHGAQVEIADISGFPVFSQDIEADGLPADVTALAESIRGADGVIFATPEYNYSIAAPLKNAIDWISRARNDDGVQPFSGKPVAIVGSGGGMRTMRAQNHLRQVGVFLNFKAFNGEFGVNYFAEKIFDDEGNIVDEATQKRLAEHLAGFVDFVKA
ncbi:NADPH-dependent FMN reductase [Thecamonas trahens ATCC 50062]|uniref:NADPH-dependent FMN reductase n=1 Tax=Thecamonas trahens ATCC 50062 TaxID=461836 RepID=A0A0L0DR94_THETB|nr:NADPH-dependent FMN reductase [Thecamonas trahens ATCC 50062]KNC54772.1 NADPH-dependent FMN reductase [Thecamonas trahens ATCC 50062]|eukprot:XP_013761672.1 NADPH-dependent FMN reductase [Thecamonas trahens ATCC 50062]